MTGADAAVSSAALMSPVGIGLTHWTVTVDFLHCRNGGEAEREEEVDDGVQSYARQGGAG